MNNAAWPVGTVTFLFSDIENSTDLVRAVGNGVFASIRADHRRILREAFAAHGGTEIDTAGDGFFVAFDSARSGTEAAIQGQRALSEVTWPAGAKVRVRMGLHTAEPHLGEDGYVGVGVHRASRICDAGHGGQILLSNATAGIIEDVGLSGVGLIDLGEHRLKGLEAAQRLFQISALGLQADFDPPRTVDSAAPGVGTFLGCDLSGFRHVLQTAGDDASAALIAKYHAAVTATVEEHSGVALELIADNALTVFRSASDALRAAARLRAAVSVIEWPPGCEVSLRVCVHSGRWSGDPRRPNAATAIYRLLRLAATFDRGPAIVSATTAALVDGDPDVPELRDLGERDLGDLGRMRAYELVDS